MDYQLTQTGEQTQNLLDKVPTIETNLNAEILRSTNKDEELETAIGNEKTRAEGAEGALETAIGNEKTRAEGAELALAGDIEDNATAIGNEKTRAEGAEGTLQENIEAEATARENADDALQDGIDGINGKIPNAASSSNQLADKAFVNSSIATNTADFKGTYNSLEQLEQVSANANDYGFVVSVDSAGNTVYNRYKYVEGTGWMFEYALNNSSFTAAQWAAIQSGITSLLVAKLAELPTVDQLTTQLNQIIASVTAEKTRAENAEDALSASIAANTTAISAEKTRAEGAEAVLREDIADNALAIAAEKTRAEGAEGTLQTAVNNEKTRAEGAELTLQQNINAEATLRDNADDTLQANIDAINAKIPSAASSSNQLADKAFVNSSISTNTAEFKGTYNSLAELQAVTGANANDYGFVIATDAAGNTVYNRYKYVEGTGWVFEYALNNSSFTSEQWAAIQSGITALLVSKLSGLPDIDGLNAMFAAITSLIPSAATSSNKLVDYAQMVAALATKQNTLTFDEIPTAGSDNPVESKGILAAINAAIAPLATQTDLTTLAGRVTTAEGRITTAEANITSLDGRISTNEADIAALQALYNALQQSAPQVIEPTDTWPVANPSATVIYRVIDRVNTPPEYYSDYMWNGTAFVLMATYNNAIDDVPTAGSDNLVKSGGVYNVNKTLFDVLGKPTITDVSFNTRYSKISNTGVRTDDGGYIQSWGGFLLKEGQMLIVHSCAGNDISVLSSKVMGGYTPLIIGNDASSAKDYYYVARHDTNCDICSKRPNENLYAKIVSFSDAKGLEVTDNYDKIIDNYVHIISNESTYLPYADVAENIGAGEAGIIYLNRSGGHKIFRVHEGDVVTIESDLMVYTLLKSYYPPILKDTDLVYFDDPVSGYEEFRATRSSVTFTVPATAKYLVCTSSGGGGYTRTPTKFTINDYDVLKGVRQEVQDLKEESVVQTPQSFHLIANSGRNTSQYTIQKGKTYKLSFQSDYFAIPAGEEGHIGENFNYLRIFAANYATSWFNTTTESTPKVVPVPSEITFTATKDGYIFIICTLAEGAYLDVTITEQEQNVFNIVKDNLKFELQKNDFVSWQIENMLLGGSVIGDLDATNSYCVGCDIDDKGTCYAGYFYSKTITGESSGGEDWVPSLAIFNLASPAITNRNYVAVELGEQVTQDKPDVLIHSTITQAKKINSTTVRVLMSLNEDNNGSYNFEMVYKDFNLANNTFEEYAHTCRFLINGQYYNADLANAQTIAETLNLETFDESMFVAAATNIITINGQYYAALTIYGYSHSIFRSTDLSVWEFVTDIPLGYLTDEVSIFYNNGRIYAAATGNKTRRPSATFDQMLYYDMEAGTWTTPVQFDNINGENYGYYGHDLVPLAIIDNKIYSIHTVLDYDSSTDQASRPANYVNHLDIMRGIKTLFVQDLELNVIGKYEMRFRRPFLTSSFNVHFGNLYSLAGTNPKGLLDADGRQNLTFSYVDVRYMEL